MELKIAAEEEKVFWDSLVERSSYSTIFHKWDFLEIIKKHTGLKLYRLIAFKGTTPVGIYPVFLQKKPFTKIILSPPSNALLLYMGPAFVDYEKLKQSSKESLFLEMQKEFNRFAESELGSNYVRIRPVPGLSDARPFQWTGYMVKPLYTYIADISKGTDHLWKEINDATRASIQKAENVGVKVREGGKEDLEVLRKSVAGRLGEQGYKSDNYKKYLEEVFDAFHPHNFHVFVGEYDGQPAGGLTLLCYKNRASLWLGIPKTDIKGVYPNDLVVWESMKWACKNGYTEYEIMCGGDDPRLRHFKSKFNPEPVLWYSAEKHSSAYYEALEFGFSIYKKFKRK